MRRSRLGAQGVGLFRTEFLFLERTSPPSEDEQCAAYERVDPGVRSATRSRSGCSTSAATSRSRTCRSPTEANPFLGVRALRLAFAEPDLFVTQLRACYRAAAAGPVKVMAPMVADAGDVDLLLSLAERARNELAAEGSEIGEVALGVMLEIPSAILVGGLLLRADRFRQPRDERPAPVHARRRSWQRQRSSATATHFTRASCG